jgi:hypothetical protein
MDKNKLNMLSFADAVGLALNTKIKLFASCVTRRKSKTGLIKTGRYMLCFGQEKIYILNRNISKLKLSFGLDNIKEIVLDRENTSSFLVIFKDNIIDREQKVSYIFLSVAGREKIVKELMAVYATFYAFKYGMVLDLNITQKEIKFAQKFLMQKSLMLYHRPPDKYKQVILKDHM